MTHAALHHPTAYQQTKVWSNHKKGWCKLWRMNDVAHHLTAYQPTKVQKMLCDMQQDDTYYDARASHFSIVHQPTKDVTNYGAWCLASFVQTHKRMMQIMTHFALHHSTAHQHTNVHTSTNANAHTHTTLSNEHLAECPQLGFWRAEFAIGVLCVFPVHTWVASKIWDVKMKTH